MQSFPLRHSSVVPLATALALALAGCGGADEGGQQGEGAGPEPRGTYSVDAATGETAARHTDASGTVTILRSGRRVPLALPEGFTLFPQAEVTNNTRVDRDDGRIVLIDMTSAAEPEELVGFYRAEAEAAGIAIGTALESDRTQTIGGTGADGTRFSFTATREDDMTRAQLSVGRGIE